MFTTNRALFTNQNSELDWNQIEWKQFGFDKGNPNKKLIYDSLRAQYHLFCNLFQHFAGSGQIGERYGITLIEFGHICHFARLINFRLQKGKVEDLFHDSIRSSEDHSESKEGAHQAMRPLMSRINLVEAVVRIASNECEEKSLDNIATAFIETVEGPLADAWIALSDNFIVSVLVAFSRSRSKFKVDPYNFNNPI